MSLTGVSLARPHQFPLKRVEEFPLTTIGFGWSHKEVAKYLLELTSQPICKACVCTVHTNGKERCVGGSKLRLSFLQGRLA